MYKNKNQSPNVQLHQKLHEAHDMVVRMQAENTELARINTQFAQRNYESSSTIEGYKKVIVSQNGEIQQLKSQYNSMLAREANLQAYIDSLEERFKNSQNHLNAAYEKVEQLTARCDIQDNYIKALTDELAMHDQTTAQSMPQGGASMYGRR